MARIKARGVEASEAELKLFSMIENIDENGTPYGSIDTWGLRESTLVILATDQGVNDRGAPKPRFDGKRQNHTVAYDEKHAVFCMMRYPPLTQAHANYALAGMVDIAPTIMDLVGLPQPMSLDGRSLSPLLGGEREWSDDRKLIVQCPRNRYRAYWQNAVVKSQKWRLVGGNELYDIVADPGQKHNVAAHYRDVMESLANHYDRFWESLTSASDLLSRHALGAPDAPEVRLVCMDWYQGGNPWHQLHLTRAKSNGIWAIDVAQAGRYQFELRWYPREAPTPIGATKASIRVGSAYQQMAIEKSDAAAVFEMELQTGQFDLETAFDLPEDASHRGSFGAYFVYVSYLDA